MRINMLSHAHTYAESIKVQAPGRSDLADDIFSRTRYLDPVAARAPPPLAPEHRPTTSVKSITPVESGDDLALTHKWYLRTLIGINAIFVFLALILVAAGSWALGSEVAASLAGQTLPAGVVVLGIFIMFVAFCGCAGAIRQSRWMLVTYACTLVLLLICQARGAQIAR
jgi:hypothetical protein